MVPKKTEPRTPKEKTLGLALQRVYYRGRTGRTLLYPIGHDERREEV